MNAFLSGVQLVTVLLPMIHQIVLLVEQAFPGAKRGAEKVDAVVEAVTNLAPAIGVSAQQAASLKDSVQAIASTVVSAYKAGTGSVPTTPAAAVQASPSAQFDMPTGG